MKPWQDEWEYDNADSEVRRVGGGVVGRIMDTEEGRLAAQAPSMAQELLAVIATCETLAGLVAPEAAQELAIRARKAREVLKDAGVEP